MSKIYLGNITDFLEISLNEGNKSISVSGASSLGSVILFGSKYYQYVLTEADTGSKFKVLLPEDDDYTLWDDLTK